MGLVYDLWFALCGKENIVAHVCIFDGPCGEGALLWHRTSMPLPVRKQRGSTVTRMCAHDDADHTSVIEADFVFCAQQKSDHHGRPA